MGDIRFTMAGIALVFAGFIVLGTMGGQYQSASMEAEEFGTCYDYSGDSGPVIASCDDRIGQQSVFFGIVIAIICGGAASLVKGIRGDWDSRVRPEEMVGPGGGATDEDRRGDGTEGRGPDSSGSARGDSDGDEDGNGDEDGGMYGK